MVVIDLRIPEHGGDESPSITHPRIGSWMVTTGAWAPDRSTRAAVSIWP